MGVEPTAARAVRPAASFEDWEAHRDSDTPADIIADRAPDCQGVRAAFNRYAEHAFSPAPAQGSPPVFAYVVL